MIEVIPAILPKNYEDLKNKIALVRGAVPMVQVDICDGIFTKNTTWPFVGGNFDTHFRAILDEEEGMPFWEDIDFELDLMVSDAVEKFDLYTKLGPKSIIFHLEAVGLPAQAENLENFKDFIEGIDMYIRDSMKIGVAINPTTPVEQLLPLISHIDFVQCMGNDKIGYHGVELDGKVYERIKILRGKYPDLPIAVDIGVDKQTAPMLIQAGVTKLVVGSAIFNTDDIIGTIEEFKTL